MLIVWLVAAISYIGGYVDRTLLGAAHLYHHGPYDPEGLLTLLPVLATVLIGYWIIEFVRARPIGSRTSIVLVVAGALALVLADFWNASLPLNKRLWTSSWVVLTAGWAMIGFAVAYEVIEVRRIRWFGKPFEVLGRNALVAYVGSVSLYALVDRWRVHVVGTHTWPLRRWLFHRLFERTLIPHIGPFKSQIIYALTALMLWWLVFWVLYRKRIFIRA